jgi:secondary thiamine-phosphate synthase enzyme
MRHPFTIAIGRGRTLSAGMLWHQTTIRLRSHPRGYHLVTRDVLAAVPEVERLGIGFLHLFLQHTSASLIINENADPDVRADFERWSDRVAPDGAPYLEHTTEGADDMPAHIKSAMFGVSLTIPVRDGRLQLGTWQGIYLGEHRDQGGTRSVVATLWGEPRG